MIALDASALVDAVLDQPAGEWVLEQIAGEEVAAPAHQSAEVLSALSRLVRAGEIEPATARTRSTRRPHCRSESSFSPLLTCGALTNFASASRAGRPVRRPRRRARLQSGHHGPATGSGYRAVRRPDPVVAKAGTVHVPNTPLPVLVVVHNVATSIRTWTWAARTEMPATSEVSTSTTAPATYRMIGGSRPQGHRGLAWSQ